MVCGFNKKRIIKKDKIIKKFFIKVVTTREINPSKKEDLKKQI